MKCDDYVSSAKNYITKLLALQLNFTLPRNHFKFGDTAMVEVTKEGILLEKTALDFESHGVLNPAVIREGNTVHLFYRAVKDGNHSTIGYCRLDGPHEIVSRNTEALISPEFPYEIQGVEDPRICLIDDTYYLTYTAYNGVNALGALATSKDLKHFEKKGIIVPQLSYSEFEALVRDPGHVNHRYWDFFNPSPCNPEIEVDRNNLVWDKDVLFFPRRIQGKLHFLHRIKPDIQLVAVNELSELTPSFWKEYISNLEENTILFPKYEHEINYIGAGAPPIETPLGWLLIYHGVKCTPGGNIYAACAALLDIHDPKKEIARLPYPLFEPEEEWELKGEVNNVCFPCGTALFGDTLYIYYGAADEQIAYASVSLAELISELKLNTIKDEASN